MKTKSHYYIGIDMHKRFSQVHVLDTQGKTAWKGRIDDNDPALFAGLVKKLGGRCHATFEASMNWHVLYEELVGIKDMVEVIMAHPWKLRIICDAEVKNDKVDAQRLAQLLRLGMIPRAYACRREARMARELIRQRSCWVAMRTRVRNRTHRLLGSIPGGVELPQCSDMFGVKSLKAMRQLRLPTPHDLQLAQNLAMLDAIKEPIAKIEERLEELCHSNKDVALLRGIPGLGKVLACVVGSEIDDINRFPTKASFISYCGLAPTTRGSAGKSYNGRMMLKCNRWLKWAFVEAAWVTIGCDAYCGTLYKEHRARGKQANTAITIVARRLAQISWEILKNKRPYETRTRMKPFPARSGLGLAGKAA